jgi:hypothetical protein
LNNAVIKGHNNLSPAHYHFVACCGIANDPERANYTIKVVGDHCKRTTVLQSSVQSSRADLIYQEMQENQVLWWFTLYIHVGKQKHPIIDTE